MVIWSIFSLKLSFSQLFLSLTIWDCFDVEFFPTRTLGISNFSNYLFYFFQTFRYSVSIFYGKKDFYHKRFLFILFYFFHFSLNIFLVCLIYSWAKKSTLTLSTKDNFIFQLLKSSFLTFLFFIFYLITYIHFLIWLI